MPGTVAGHSFLCPPGGARLDPRPRAVLFRLRHDPDVGLRRFPARGPNLLGFLVGDRARDDDVFALFPVRGRGHAMLRGHLQGIDDAENFLEIATRGHRIDQHQLDFLVGPDDENVADRLVVGRRAGGDVAGCRGREHVVKLGNVEIGIADHWVVRRGTLRLADVLRPFGVAVDRVDRETYQLDTAFVELRLQFGQRAKFSGADRSEVFRVREQQRPAVADPVVEFDLAFGGLGLEIRGHRANLQSHSRPLALVWGEFRRFEYREGTRLSERPGPKWQFVPS